MPARASLPSWSTLVRGARRAAPKHKNHMSESVPFHVHICAQPRAPAGLPCLDSKYATSNRGCEGGHLLEYKRICKVPVAGALRPRPPTVQARGYYRTAVRSWARPREPAHAIARAAGLHNQFNRNSTKRPELLLVVTARISRPITAAQETLSKDWQASVLMQPQAPSCQTTLLAGGPSSVAANEKAWRAQGQLGAEHAPLPPLPSQAELMEMTWWWDEEADDGRPCTPPLLQPGSNAVRASLAAYYDACSQEEAQLAHCRSGAIHRGGVAPPPSTPPLLLLRLAAPAACSSDLNPFAEAWVVNPSPPPSPAGTFAQPPRSATILSTTSEEEEEEDEMMMEVSALLSELSLAILPSAGDKSQPGAGQHAVPSNILFSAPPPPSSPPPAVVTTSAAVALALGGGLMLGLTPGLALLLRQLMVPLAPGAAALPLGTVEQPSSTITTDDTTTTDIIITTTAAAAAGDMEQEEQPAGRASSAAEQQVLLARQLLGW